MHDDPYPPMRLHLRLTRTRAGAVRIEHAYSRADAPDHWQVFSQVPSARTKIRRVWSELKVLVAIWLERDRQDDPALAEAAAHLPRVESQDHLG